MKQTLLPLCFLMCISTGCLFERRNDPDPKLLKKTLCEKTFDRCEEAGSPSCGVIWDNCNDDKPPISCEDKHLVCLEDGKKPFVCESILDECHDLPPCLDMFERCIDAGENIEDCEIILVYCEPPQETDCEMQLDECLVSVAESCGCLEGGDYYPDQPLVGCCNQQCLMEGEQRCVMAYEECQNILPPPPPQPDVCDAQLKECLSSVAQSCGCVEGCGIPEDGEQWIGCCNQQCIMEGEQRCVMAYEECQNILPPPPQPDDCDAQLEECLFSVEQSCGCIEKCGNGNKDNHWVNSCDKCLMEGEQRCFKEYEICEDGDNCRGDYCWGYPL